MDKRNEPEARRIIDCVFEKYEQIDHSKAETVGIITINLPQCELIRRLLSEIEDEEFAAWADEHVDVVNLESCQGKEWDYVFLSIVHIPDGSDSLRNSIGALGREGGSNRLNVMLTRAKKQMVVASSFKPEQMTDVQYGAKDLRDFLKFVMNHNGYMERAEVQQETDNITESAARMLRERGWTVHTCIGSGRVDIGIMSRKNAEQYEMGILVDHPCTEYYTAMDQEIICPETLRSKGWNKIHHLRVKNWYMNPSAEIDMIVQKLNQ
ncbi:MAG: AAA domain-containing protein [Clostridia bacterium]|nr:AAA domain-containing protein [Clostridia bacterium]